jgi:hypothetical protein
MAHQQLPILNCGSCEPLKAAVHAAAFGLSALMTLYNAAAWLQRRERHLAINAVIYGLATIWEREHIVHHLVAIAARPVSEPQPIEADELLKDELLKDVA